MGGLGAGWASLGWALAPPRLGVSVNPIPAREGEIMHTPLLLAHPVLGSYWRPWFEFSDHDLSSDGHKIMKGFIFFVNSNFTLEIKKMRFLFLFKCHSVNLSQLSSLENCFSSIFAEYELRRIFWSHARAFAQFNFGRTHMARTCAFCPTFISHPHTQVYSKRVIL